MRIALFGKTIAPENGEYMRQLFMKLSDNQVGMIVYTPFAEMIKGYIPEGVQYDVFDSHADLNADLMFSIGGDGTILDTVPFILDSGMPLVGINMGRLGFLSSLSKNEIGKAVDSVLLGDYSVEQRTLLELVSPQNVFGDVRYALNELNVIRFRHHTHRHAQPDRASRGYPRRQCHPHPSGGTREKIRLQHGFKKLYLRHFRAA